MTRGKEHYRQNIHENTYATFYVATNTAMMEYEYIVGRKDQSSPTLASQAETYILDSAIGDENIGNEETLQRAIDLDADIVVAADVMNDPKVTVQRNLDMVQRVDQQDLDIEVMVPLQHSETLTHCDHYDMVAAEFRKHGYEIDDYRLMVGGLKDATAETQICSIIDLREHVGQSPYIHALGMGITNDWIATIRTCPWLIDSFDNASICQGLLKQGLLPDLSVDYVDYSMPRGPNSTVISTQFRESVVDMINYMISSDIKEKDAINTFDSVTVSNRVEFHKQWYSSVTDNEEVANA